MLENPLLYMGYAADKLLTIYFWIIFVRALLTWVQPDPYNPLVRIICKLVDPVTSRISRMFPTRVGMVDLAPFVLMLVIMFLQEIIARFILGAGIRIG
jgi:YggT family protein